MKSANQIAENGNTLSTATSEQAAALQQTVSALEEISSMIDKNASNADQSKESAVSSLASAEKGKTLSRELAQEIQEIQKSTMNLVQAAEESSLEITKIANVINDIESKTKVINDIVFQTKLLSFNASVEAARAGEAGKGFAVVAEEVGNLAAMSGNSAKEISSLLARSIQVVQDIVKSTQERVEQQSQESKRRMVRAIEIEKQNEQAIIQIVDGAQNVEKMVTEIAVACLEQSKGVAEVSKAMNQVDKVTHENAKTSHSAAHSSQELSAQAIRVKYLVDRLNFSIKGGKPPEELTQS
jgi:methyl-accepting chemotaxis protein